MLRRREKRGRCCRRIVAPLPSLKEGFFSLGSFITTTLLFFLAGRSRKMGEGIVGVGTSISLLLFPQASLFFPPSTSVSEPAGMSRGTGCGELLFIFFSFLRTFFFFWPRRWRERKFRIKRSPLFFLLLAATVAYGKGFEEDGGANEVSRSPCAFFFLCFPSRAPDRRKWKRRWQISSLSSLFFFCSVPVEVWQIAR